MQGLAVGGMEKGVLQLVNRARNEGSDDRLLLFDTNIGDIDRDLDPGDVPIAFVKRRPGLDWNFPSSIRRILYDWDVQILHARNDTALFYGALALIGMKRPRPHLLATYHNFPSHQTLGARLLALWASRHAERITAVSHELNEKLKDARWLCSSLVIHNGTDIQEYSPGESTGNWRSMLNIPAGDLVVGHVGRFDTNKRQIDLVEAFKLIQKQSLKTHLILVGQGPMYNAVRQSAAELNNVHFIPRVSDVVSFLRELDIFVLCSGHEGLPRALLEAMATGLPVIATQTGGIPEVIETSDGPCGILIPVENPSAIEEAIIKLSSAQYRTSLGLAARRRVVSKFSYEKTWADYESLYLSLLQKSKF